MNEKNRKVKYADRMVAITWPNDYVAGNKHLHEKNTSGFRMKHTVEKSFPCKNTETRVAPYKFCL